LEGGERSKAEGSGYGEFYFVNRVGEVANVAETEPPTRPLRLCAFRRLRHLGSFIKVEVICMRMPAGMSDGCDGIVKKLYCGGAFQFSRTSRFPVGEPKYRQQASVLMADGAMGRA